MEETLRPFFDTSTILVSDNSLGYSPLVLMIFITDETLIFQRFTGNPDTFADLYQFFINIATTYVKSDSS